VRAAKSARSSVWIWGCVSLWYSFARPAFAQTETPQTERPAQDAAEEGPATQRSAAQTPPATPQSDASPPDTPQRPPAEGSDDGLEVPATLKPLVVDTDTPTAAAPPVPAPAQRAHFGDRGQWAMMGSSNGFQVSNLTLSNSEASDFYVGGELGVDYFVVVAANSRRLVWWSQQACLVS